MIMSEVTCFMYRIIGVAKVMIKKNSFADVFANNVEKSCKNR